MRFSMLPFPESSINKKISSLRINQESLYWLLLKIFYLLPVLLSISMPFASWDYLNVTNYQLQGNAFNFAGVITNFAHSLFLDRVQFRPISAALGNIQYVMFGGEFWIWYVIRWISFWVMLKNFYIVLTHLKFSKAIALSSISIVALTATPLVLDLFNQDFFVIFFASFYLRFLMKNVEPLSNSITPNATHVKKEVIFLSLWIATLFSKEIGIIVAVWLLFFRHIVIPPSKRDYYSYYPMYLLFITFTSFRLLQIKHPSISGSLISASTLNATIRNIQGIFGYLAPYSIANLCLILLISIMLLGMINNVRRREWKSTRFKLYIVSVVGLFSCAVFFSRNVALCPRYMAVPLMFSIFIIASSVDSVKVTQKISSDKIALTFLIFLAILSPPKIYSGWFGMQQSLFNVNNDVNYIYSAMASGKEVRWSGNMPVELSETTMNNFLNKFGQHSYGVKETSGKYRAFDLGDVPDSSFIVWTTEPLAEFTSRISESSTIDDSRSLKSRLSAVHISTVDNFGFFQNATRKLKRLDQLIGSPLKDPIYCQQPIPSCFGSDFLNPDFNRQPWFIYQYGPYYFYEFSDTSHSNDSNSLKVIPIPNFLRYGSLFR